MTAEYTVTRQRQWATGKYIVEISGGSLDYTNPDALGKEYDGEFETFWGLVPAVEAAISIADQWKKDKPDKKILIGIGNTGGYTMPFEGVTACKTNYIKLRREAKKHDEQLPKCAECGEIMSDDEHNHFGNELTIDNGEYPFCSERCSDRDYERACKEEHEELLLAANSLCERLVAAGDLDSLENITGSRDPDVDLSNWDTDDLRNVVHEYCYD